MYSIIIVCFYLVAMEFSQSRDECGRFVLNQPVAEEQERKNPHIYSLFFPSFLIEQLGLIASTLYSLQYAVFVFQSSLCITEFYRTTKQLLEACKLINHKQSEWFSVSAF